MTRTKALEEIIKVRVYEVKNWDNSEDAYCKQWFGKNWLGYGLVLCSYCKASAVEFKGYIADHVCAECQASLDQLNQAQQGW